MNLELIIVFLAVIAVVAVFGLRVARRRGSSNSALPVEPAESGPIDGARDVVDASVGMFLIRRLTQRKPKETTEEITAASALTADEVAYRIGAAGAPLMADPPAAPVPPAAAGAAATAAAARAAAASAPASPFTAIQGAHAPNRMPVNMPPPVAPAPPPVVAPPRARLVRDAGFALVALVAVLVVAIVFWPSGNGPQTGGVIIDPKASPTATPKATALALASTRPASAAPSGAAATAVPSVELTPSDAPPTTNPTAKPTSKAAPPPPPPDPTPRPTPRPTPKPTPKPTPTPPPPHAVIGWSCVTSGGMAIKFTGSGSTGDQTYDWDFDDGGASSTSSEPDAHIRHSWFSLCRPNRRRARGPARPSYGDD